MTNEESIMKVLNSNSLTTVATISRRTNMSQAKVKKSIVKLMNAGDILSGDIYEYATGKTYKGYVKTK